ncbi:hypothetical protein K1T71_014375 [Dendrolimus kikuchii]|uniref:Uncharacterized protein n=1 Tax=Dendrolimus kikuchii TaxID=765133 RepID=A0ACC1CDW4_9NEOP|nr:hypothetical protein K1T71_014375 [Dendrolimus kikuchii]
MFCVQEQEHTDPFADEDPLTHHTDSSDDEPPSKRLKAYETPALNLKVYQIPAFSSQKGLSIFPSTSTLPKFVNNPLNLANPLAFATNNLQKESLHSRYSLPAKLSITPIQTPPKVCDNGEIIRYKKNGEVAKKRGPPKGYKRKPKVDLSQSLNNGILQAQNTILTSLLAANNTSLINITPLQLPKFEPPPTIIPQTVAIPQIKVPEGVELVELDLDPEDWFPSEPYRMVFSKKKNPKWKSFPYQCEHCFKGYRVASTLIAHAAERHGCVPKDLAIPCPCCPHISTRRKQHKKHLETHESRRHRLFCLYCLPPADPKEPYVKESERYPFDKFPQYWYASEESLRLHKKRKHPYSAMFNYNWYSTWGENTPNS